MVRAGGVNMKRLMIGAACAVLLSSSLPARAEKSPEAQKTETDTKFDLSASAGDQAAGQGGSAVHGAYGSKAARSGLTSSLSTQSHVSGKIQIPLSAKPEGDVESNWKKVGELAGAGAMMGFVSGGVGTACAVATAQGGGWVTSEVVLGGIVGGAIVADLAAAAAGALVVGAVAAVGGIAYFVVKNGMKGPGAASAPAGR